MKVVIYDRMTLPGDSYGLVTLTEAGERKLFKIPGILKSKKRSGYNYYPGVIWNFTFFDSPGKYIIPRESTLLFSPFKDNVEYNVLLDLQRLLSPLKKLRDNDLHPQLFKDTTAALSFFHETRHKAKAIYFFYLRFLFINGLLSLEPYCSNCSKKPSYYSLQHGPLCDECNPKNNFLFKYKEIESVFSAVDFKQVNFPEKIDDIIEMLNNTIENSFQ